MLSFIMTDEIDIISVAYDEFGKETTSVSSARARVAERNKLIKSVAGKEVFSNIQVLVSPDVIVKQTYRIAIKKICGVAYVTPNKEWQIVQLSNGHIFSRMFIELWLGA